MKIITARLECPGEFDADRLDVIGLTPMQENGEFCGLVRFQAVETLRSGAAIDYRLVSDYQARIIEGRGLIIRHELATDEEWADA